MKKWTGADMRCPTCNKYMPDRCICNGPSIEERRASSAAAVPVDALPPLPEPLKSVEVWVADTTKRNGMLENKTVEPMEAYFDADQMQAYARAAVEADRAQPVNSVALNLEAQLRAVVAQRDAALADRAQQGELVKHDILDAHRYRWLRSNNIVANVRFHFASGESPYLYAEELDNAIDHNMGYDPLAAKAAAPADALKDHEIREAVNTLRDIAVKYHAAQQLREQIAYFIVPLLRRAAAPVPERAEAQPGIPTAGEE